MRPHRVDCRRHRARRDVLDPGGQRPGRQHLDDASTDTRRHRGERLTARWEDAVEVGWH
jgi:hypothetical protein